MTNSDPFASLAASLRAATSASRATVRLCVDNGQPELIAESLAPGVVSMSTHVTPGIAEAPTYRFLEERQTLLIQNDCRSDPVPPPASLLDVFHVRAQMLAPVLIEGVMVATISVHDEQVRAWSECDVESLRAAQAAIATALLELGKDQ